jgi:hypothetical protein
MASEGWTPGGDDDPPPPPRPPKTTGSMKGVTGSRGAPPVPAPRRRMTAGGDAPNSEGGGESGGGDGGGGPLSPPSGATGTLATTDDFNEKDAEAQPPAPPNLMLLRRDSDDVDDDDVVGCEVVKEPPLEPHRQLHHQDADDGASPAPSVATSRGSEEAPTATSGSAAVDLHRISEPTGDGVADVDEYRAPSVDAADGRRALLRIAQDACVFTTLRLMAPCAAQRRRPHRAVNPRCSPRVLLCNCCLTQRSHCSSSTTCTRTSHM